MSTDLVITKETRSIAIASMEKNRAALSFDTIFNRLPIVDNTTALIPVDECHAIKQMVKHCKEPAGETLGAADTIRFMMGAFPQKDTTDTNVYLAHMVRVFSKYPESLHSKVAEEVADTMSWRPAPADLTKLFDAHLTRWVYADIIAGKHIKEHKKRDAEKRDDLTEAEIEANKKRFEDLIQKTFGAKDNRTEKDKAATAAEINEGDENE